MTLEDAFNGLLLYLSSRPNGGTRAELISMAVARGFEEPLLNEWLDVFLGGFVTIGYLDGADYDANFAPKVQEVGVAVASRAARAVFLHLTESGADLDVVRKQNALMKIEALISTLQTQRTRMGSGRALIVSNFPDNPTRVATLGALDFGIAHQDRSIAGAVATRDELLTEIAALQG